MTSLLAQRILKKNLTHQETTNVKTMEIWIWPINSRQCKCTNTHKTIQKNTAVINFSSIHFPASQKENTESPHHLTTSPPDHITYMSMLTSVFNKIIIKLVSKLTKSRNYMMKPHFLSGTSTYSIVLVGHFTLRLFVVTDELFRL